MVNIVSTTTPAASNAQAMTLKALQQRMAEQQAQAGALARPHVVTSPWQGIGDIANTFFNNRRADYLQGQEKITRDTLAKMRASWGPTGPTQAQAAEYSALDPEEGNRVGDQAAQYAQAQATQQAGFGHEDSTLAKTQGFTADQNKLARDQTQHLQDQADKLTLSGREDLQELPDEYKIAHNLPAGAKVDKNSGKIVVPNVGAEGQPLQPVTAVNVGGAADFVKEAPKLIEDIESGNVTDWKSDVLTGWLGIKGKSSATREAIERGVDQLKQLKPNEAERIDKAYTLTTAMGPDEAKQVVTDLAKELESAGSSIRTGHNPAAVPGGDTAPPAPETDPSKLPVPDAATPGEALPETGDKLVKGKVYVDGTKKARYLGVNPANPMAPENWQYQRQAGG